MVMPDIDRFVTVAEAAGMLGLTKTRIDQFIRDDRLAVARRVGGLRLLSRAAVAAFAKLDRPPGHPKKGKA